MTKYIVIADSCSGHLAFYYNKLGLLVEFQMNSWDANSEQHAGMLKSLQYCVTDKGLLEFVYRYKYKVRKEPIDLSFDRFKRMYGIARDSFKAEPKWKKMSMVKQYETLQNLKAYLMFCKRNPEYIQMYPAAYLNGHTMDDWDKVPDWKK